MKTLINSLKKSMEEDPEGFEPHRSAYRWVMLALLWLLYASFGLVSRAIAPLVTPILQDLQISYSQMGLILGSWQLTYIAGSLVAGTALDKWGIRKSVFVGILTVILSALLRYFPKDLTGMLLVVALFGAGAPMISIGCPKAISLWFRGRSRGTAVGVYMSGSFIGGLFALTLTNSLVMPLMNESWRLTFVAYGLLCFVFALLWWFLARDLPSPVSEENAGILQTFVRLGRIRNVQIVLVMGLLTFATLHGFNHWLPKLLETGGMSARAAGFKASIPMAVSIPALLLITRLVPPGFRGRFVAISAFLTAVTLILIVSTSGVIQLAALILYGITQSSFLPILTLILMDSPEVEARFMGSAGGMFFCVAEVGGFSGPLIMGVLVDLTGAFLAGGLFCAILNLIIIAMTPFLRIRTGGSC